MSRDPFIFKEFPLTVLKILSFTYKLEGFFFNDFELFSRLQNHSFGPHSIAQKIVFYFFKCEYLISTRVNIENML